MVPKVFRIPIPVLTLSTLLLACDGDSPPSAREPTDTTTAMPAGFLKQMSAGYYHVCGITSGRAVYCWGWAHGLYGSSDPSEEAATRPTRIAGTLLDTISSGAGMTCGLAATAFCWGTNESGQLGIEGESAMCGQVFCTVTPTPVADPSAFDQIAAGGGHTCAITADRVAYCWGYPSYGRLGTAANTDNRLPAPVNTTLRFIRIAPAGTHTCGIATDGQAYCWGYGEGGQIGHGLNVSTQSTPARVSGDHTFSEIDSGSGHTCALRLDGGVFCWGANGYGQLGNAITSQSNVPVRAGTLPFTTISAGANHTCAIAGGSVGYCWGKNEEGQLGDGTTTDRPMPTPIATDLRFTQLTAGYHFTCGLTTDGVAVCWGLNYRGGLGVGSDEPIRVVMPRRVAAPVL